MSDLKTKPKVIYMGTPDFAVPALKALAEIEAEIVYVVTQPDRPRGRGHKLTPSPVKKVALELGIPVLQPDKIKTDEAFFSKLSEAAPNLIVVAAYGKILPISILELPTEGCVNLHASLLPKFRGPAPIHRAIEAGERESGISLMYVSEKLDHGDVIAAESLEIEGMNSGELHDALAEIGAKLLIEHFDDIVNGKASRTPQDDSLATYTAMLSKEEGHIDFSWPVKKIENKVLAMTPFPGAFAYIGDVKYKILEAHALDDDEALPVDKAVNDGEKGTILNIDDRIVVVAGDGYFEIEKIQIPNGKPVRVCDFLRGHQLPEKAIFR